MTLFKTFFNVNNRRIVMDTYGIYDKKLPNEPHSICRSLRLFNFVQLSLTFKYLKLKLYPALNDYLIFNVILEILNNN